MAPAVLARVRLEGILGVREREKRLMCPPGRLYLLLDTVQEVTSGRKLII